jgi:DNA-binding response OmpR family regulator
MRVLLVEANKAQRDLVKVALQQFEGTIVDTAEDNWAVEMARENAYQAIVLDDQLLHQGDGVLVLKDLREAGCLAPALVLSKDSGESLSRERDALNVTQVLSFPLDTIELFKAVMALREKAGANRPA